MLCEKRKRIKSEIISYFVTFGNIEVNFGFLQYFRSVFDCFFNLLVRHRDNVFLSVMIGPYYVPASILQS